MELSLDPGAIALLALAGGLYVRAVRVLRRRGQPVGRGQQTAWYAGLALTAVAFLSPVSALADELLSAHMAEHLLIADLAGPLLLIGVRTPVLQFLLPRPLLVPLARMRRLRRALAFLSRPLVAIPVYLLVLYGWHVAPLFEAALESPVLHVLQHQSFVAATLLVWWAAIEPQRRRARGELWKAGYILGARLGGMMLGMAFVVMRSPAYAGFYGDSAREHGLSPLADQQTAGAMMLSLDVAIMLGSFAYFFWRAARASDEGARGTAAVG